MDVDVPEQTGIDYNKVLAQIYVNLENALNTFGSSSPQYQAVLAILKDCLHGLNRLGVQNTHPDPEILSLAMGFLELGK